MITRFLTLFSALLFATFITNSPAHAEAKVGDAFGDWMFGCQALSAKNTICSISQSMINNDTHQRILNLSLSKRGTNKQLVLIVTAPLGLYIPAGITAMIDGKNPFKLILQSCSQSGCVAAINIDKPTEQALKNGNVLGILFSPDASGNPFLVNASLKGVTQGLNALQ